MNIDLNNPNFISNFSISNFKSIKNCHIGNTNRINLFIGRPNVGKSNILEALSLFSTPFLRENRSKSITNLVRIENETELFNNGNIEKPVVIKTNNEILTVTFDRFSGLTISIDNSNFGIDFTVDEKLNLKGRQSSKYASAIKKYSFSSSTEFEKVHSRYLIPPYGQNLLSMIETDDELKSEISDLFKQYNLQLVFDKASQSLKIMQPEKKNDIFLVPYNSIADTLQRIIFFKTAIASNRDSVLLFEEPEAHSFPPFITQITQEMIYRKENQYFLATHSPFILNDLLENARAELSVYMVDYKKNETKVNRLSDDTLHEIFQNGVDVFTNSEIFI